MKICNFSRSWRSKRTGGIIIIIIIINEKNNVFCLNPLTTNCPHHIDTIQLICSPNQLNGFDMMGEHWSLLD